jgi:histone H1/5
MGKIEDMRRLREQQFADGHKRRTTPQDPEPARAPSPAKPAPAKPAPATPAPATAAAAKAAAPADDGPAQPTRPTRPTKAKKTTSAKSGGEIAEQGKCPVCKKMKPLSNGVLAQHQKGFGKACAGARQKPA